MTLKTILLPLAAALAVILTTPPHAVADDEGGGSASGPYFVGLDRGAPEYTILDDGAVRIYAVCAGLDGLVGSRIDVLASGTVPWAQALPPAPLVPAVPALGSVQTLASVGSLPATIGAQSSSFDGVAVVGDGSDYMGISYSVIAGVNTFGYDCFAAGTTALISGSIPDPDD